jgi:DNA-binding MarR family transcriptional regulator
MIIKYIPEGGEYTAIPNTLVRDYNLSVQAFGLLVECLSYPKNWVIHNSEILKRYKMNKNALSTILRELEKKGYLFYWKGGQLKGTIRVVSFLSMSTSEWKEVVETIDVSSLNIFRESKKLKAREKQVYINKDNNINKEHVFRKTDNLPTEDNPSGFPFQESNLPTPNKKDDKGKQLRLTNHSSPAYKLAEHQALSLLKCYPDRKLEKERTLQKWAKEYQRALSKDERDYNEIVEVIDFVMSPLGWPNDRFSAGAIVRKFDILLEEAKLKSKKYDVREKDPELSKLLINYWGQFTGQATSTEEWKPSSEVLNDLIQIANNLYVAYKGSPIQDKWTWITTFGKFLESEYKNKGIVPRLSVLLKPMVWENDFPIWKQINNIL